MSPWSGGTLTPCPTCATSMTEPGARLTLVVAVAMVMVAVPAAGQTTPETLELSTDLPRADGAPVALAGQPFQVQASILQDSGAPEPHNDVAWTVTWNGDTWYATTPASGHDYDGVAAVTLVLPAEGSFSVTVEVPTDDETLTRTLEGRVAPAPDDLETVEVDLEVPDTASAGELIDVRYRLTGHQAPVPSSAMALVEVIDTSDARTVLRVPTTIGAEATELSYALPSEGTYEVRVTAWDPLAALAERPLDAVSTREEITVEPAGAQPPTAPPTERPLMNRVDTTSKDGYRLHATYDPYTSVSTNGRLHLGTVLEAGGAPTPIERAATEIVGPAGETVLSTDALAAPTGIAEVVIAPEAPGDYEMVTTASSGGWSGEVAHRFSVHAPVVPMSAGPSFASAEGLDDVTAGEASEVVFRMRDAAGQPVGHAELELAVWPDDAGEAPVLRHKLHTHSDGDFPVEMTVPDPGMHTVRLDPVDLELSPVTSYHGPEPGTQAVFGMDAASSPVQDEAAPGPDSETTRDAGASSAWLVTVAAMAALALVGVRRRSR